VPNWNCTTGGLGNILRLGLPTVEQPINIISIDIPAISLFKKFNIVPFYLPLDVRCSQDLQHFFSEK
jgi:hypothetical protein